MMRYGIGVAVMAMVWLAAGNAAARDRQILEKNFQAAPQVKTVTLSGDISAAELRLDAHDGGDLFTGRVRYDAERTEVDIALDKTGSAAEVEMIAKRLHKRGDLNSEGNLWTVSLSREYLWDIGLDIGAAECLLDLSGLPLQSLTLDVGASECEIVFDRPNPQELKRFSIDAGAGEMDVRGLGYARCRDFEFDGGAGSVEMDFDGFTSGFGTAHVDVGVGEIEIELPGDLPVRIIADDGWLSSVEIDDDVAESVRDGVWESPGYEKGTHGLELSIDVGIGQVTVTRSR